ncbi:hypothetical protein U1Q18_030576, partial [Sarracenia purpurea var. burkii]
FGFSGLNGVIQIWFGIGLVLPWSRLLPWSGVLFALAQCYPDLSLPRCSTSSMCHAFTGLNVVNQIWFGNGPVLPWSHLLLWSGVLLGRSSALALAFDSAIAMLGAHPTLILLSNWFLPLWYHPTVSLCAGGLLSAVGGGSVLCFAYAIFVLVLLEILLEMGKC